MAFTVPAWVAEAVPPDANTPYATGVHNCFDQYPAKANGAEGVTSLDYRIGDDGNAKAVTIRVSSGSPELDKAAVECVEKWSYMPAKLYGKPIEIAWRTDVKWTAPASAPATAKPAQPQPAGPTVSPDRQAQNGAPLNGSSDPKQSQMAPSAASIIAPKSTGARHVCGDDYPVDAIFEHAQGTTGIRFIITTEGRTRDVTVTSSSGFVSLDTASITCASRWLYIPALKDGTPVEVPWMAKVEWALH